VHEYLTYGVRPVLVVHPRTQSVTAYRPDGSARVFRSGEAIDGGDVVPGFSLPVDELFRA
jgi:Uma2 family endonuclease